MSRKRAKTDAHGRGANPTAARPRRRWVLPMCLVLGGMLIALEFLVFGGHDVNAQAATSPLRLEDIPFDGARAYGYLKQICEIGPRPSGSPGMAAQQKLLVEHFKRLGADVEMQQFTGADPRDGRAVPMANLIVHFKPEKPERILLCAHYDTLPFPMSDPEDPKGRFVGANDGGSGAALLMELGGDVAKIRCKYGIDFVLFDAEEYIFDKRDRFFLGSEHFSKQYRDNPPGYRYRWAVLLDMIGDADLQIYQESNTMWWRDSRPLVGEIWGTARRLGIREFIPRKKHEVLDDHLALHNIAGIPACDIIDFDYPPWHTRADTVQKCSALSLAKVGWVLREWLGVAQ
ncbi:MAG: M28 family peptidase [Planctomycetia bacterium]|nr:M28 family peptidase [Planctomycetia bacterium]